MFISFLNRLEIWKGAVVCVDATIEGDVVIGAGTVVHPGARILALSGPIVIGENNIIEETAVIKNWYLISLLFCNTFISQLDIKSTENSVLSIGNSNYIHAGASMFIFLCWLSQILRCCHYR